MSQAADQQLEPTLPEVKRYQHEKLRTSLLTLGISLVACLFLALWLGPRLDGLLLTWCGDNRWLRLIAVAGAVALLLELLTLPLDYYSGFVLEHRYGLSNQTLTKWLKQRLKGYLIGGPLGLIMMLGFYSLLWYSGWWWWLWAGLAWLLVSVVLGQLLPVVILPLFYKVTRLEDAGLLERLRRLAAGTGLSVEGVYQLHLSSETRKANAALAGLGRTRRVLLGDTLLENFTPEEIEVVFAHEVGHHVYRHLPKMMAADVVLTVTGLGLADRLLRHLAPSLGYLSFDDPSALPLFLLIMMLFGILLAPALNGLSRLHERQCDRYALRRTRRVDAFRSAFVKLARQNKADPDPHPFVVWLFDDHPPIRERLALADEPLPVV